MSPPANETEKTLALSRSLSLFSSLFSFSISRQKAFLLSSLSFSSIYNHLNSGIGKIFEKKSLQVGRKEGKETEKKKKTPSDRNETDRQTHRQIDKFIKANVKQPNT